MPFVNKPLKSFYLFTQRIFLNTRKEIALKMARSAGIHLQLGHGPHIHVHMSEFSIMHQPPIQPW